ncbi:MAG TPA: hypothetical protein PLB03_02410 [Candidatus Fimenecus sp.]|nr:hypothetical protein [Candidatus Fimenecus sp.]
MNIFETIYECNINHPSKLALSVTMDDGSTRAYTYGDVFSKVAEYADRLLSSGVREGARMDDSFSRRLQDKMHRGLNRRLSRRRGA